MKSFKILLIGSIILILISTGCINRKEESDSNHEKDIPEKYKDLALDCLKFSPDGSKALISGFKNEVGILVL